MAVAGLGDVAPVEAWTATGSSHDLAYATHGLFRYFGKMPPPVARYLIESHTDPEDLVYDPMCGSGTTGVEAVLTARRAVLADVSPIARLVARVKSRWVARGGLEAALDEVRERYVPLADGFEPVGLRNVGHWFLPETMASLRGLRAVIGKRADGPVTDFLWAAFAGTVRRVSRATTQQGRLFLDADTAMTDALTPFVRRAHRGAEAVAALPRDAARRVEVVAHDLRNPWPHERPEPARLVILHPPYFTGYRYSRVNSLELAWLGEAHAAVRRHEVREFFKHGESARAADYAADVAAAVVNASRLLARGGTIALMVGDTALRGEHVPVTRAILDRLRPEGIGCRLIALRVPQYTEASWVSSQRRGANDLGIKLYDYVLLLEPPR